MASQLPRIWRVSYYPNDKLHQGKLIKTRLLLMPTIYAFICLAMFFIQSNVKAVMGDGNLEPNFGVEGKARIDFNGLNVTER